MISELIFGEFLFFFLLIYDMIKVWYWFEDVGKQCGCQHSTGSRCLTQDKKSMSKKGRILKKKMHFKLSPLIVWIALWIVLTYSKFQVNIFSKNRDMTKCQFLHNHDDATKGYSNTLGFLRKKLR